MKKRKLKKKFIYLGLFLLCFFSIFWIWNSYQPNYVIHESTENRDGLLKQLEEESKKNSKISKIVKQSEQYPEELLKLALAEEEAIDFVIDYPTKKGRVYGEEVTEAKEGEIPFLLQWDKRWGYAFYGDTILAINGCGPTVLSMAVIGLTGNKKVTPYVVAQYAVENDFYVRGSGTSWNLMLEGATHFGLQSEEIPLTESKVFDALNKGHVVICSMKPGDFTTTGHFIILVGEKDGKLKVYDPNSRKRSQEWWDYETLESQIKNLWEVSKA